MAEIGKTQSLEIVKHVDFGVYLDGDMEEEILLPQRYLPENEEDWEVGKLIDVFVYLDSEDRPIATTETPLAEVGDCACLTVINRTKFGAFLDWGLSKDLLVPFKEQRVPMEPGRSYVVYLYLDNTGRIAATSRLSRHLSEQNEDEFKVRQKVDLLVATRSEMGYKVVINGTHLGLIHNDDVTRLLQIGDRLTGFVKEPRPDGRINITLQRPANELRHELADQIMDYLQENDGRCNLTDKSDPEAIRAIFRTSKSTFKKALGKLYKDKKIILETDCIRLAGK
ncbi:S1 RNA-binding domain-containing protein [Emcibacter sp.]|uniref:CvfB family protein n=1 Tax=Emcibacter sp. TaxID=1979954 RepID=UPI002AA7D125|nr:S1-like domain-containing RNA-binding protein [Emcibacter sp.]